MPGLYSCENTLFFFAFRKPCNIFRHIWVNPEDAPEVVPATTLPRQQICNEYVLNANVFSIFRR